MAYSNLKAIPFGGATLYEAVIFRVYDDESRFSARASEKQGLEPLRWLMAWKDMELKFKPQRESFVVEWEYYPIERITPEKVRQLLEDLLALAQTSKHKGRLKGGEPWTWACKNCRIR